MLLTVRTHSFSWSEKSNEVNKDFNLCFHFDIHTLTLNIPLSLMEISTEISLHKVITQELKLNDMNLDIFVVDDHFSCGMICFNDSEYNNNSYLY